MRVPSRIGLPGRLLATVFLGVLAASMCSAQVHAQPVPGPSPAARAAWGFDRSDLTPHPDVRFGVLANGMRYALMRSAAPAGGLSARLHLAGGAALEGEREQGFMHLIEHLIFEGSANLPKGALLTMLPHQGLRRWSDFNAFTTFDETVYRLDLPRADRRARDTVLMVMREIAGDLVFTRRAVDGAKRMVRAEIGARDPVQDRIAAARDAFFVPGTPIARGPVAGTQASVGRARRAALRRLYVRTYVPQRATLVLAGDFEPAAVEAEIAGRFSGWRARAPDSEAAAPVAIRTDRGDEARLFVDPTAPTGITIAAVAPLGAAGDAGGRRDAQFLEHLGAEMLDRRLRRLAAGAGAPVLGATAAIYDHFSTARLALVEVAARDGDWRGALRTGAAELDRALAQGFTQAELDALLTANRSALAGDKAPGTATAMADAIVDAAGRGILFTAPADPAASAAYLARVRLADVDAAFRAVWDRAGRLMFVTHPRRVEGGEAAIATAWAESRRAAAAASATD